MKNQLIVAGHGGQGVLELGNYVAYLNLLRGKHVAYTPSYGPETRGGKVKCYVVTSDEEIDSPIAEEPDYLIVMNIPSMDYVALLKSGGTLLMNSSLIPMETSRTDIDAMKVPATEIAVELGNEPGRTQDTRILANSVMFGVYLAATLQEFDLNVIKSVFVHFLTDRKAALIDMNVRAVKRGYDFARATENPLVEYEG
ncbi:MAG: 2-oxoacid:acceptor oxidoreductase family protein [Nitrososphaerales archaeon]|nr:2-oxoacid:acceptor oxidoreductase family protein [Nitrososphaerales archaeon]